MKRFFVNQLVVAALIVSAAFVSSCNKDDDGGTASGAFDGVITAQVENGSQYNDLIKRVRAVGVGGAFGSGVYAANGSFTITLDLPPASTLSLLANDLEDLSDFVSISDKSAKWSDEVAIGAYSSSSGDFIDDDIVGWFYYAKLSADGNSGAEMILVYADRDVIVKGSKKQTYEDGTFTREFNMNLKQGWNRTYYVKKDTKMSDDNWDRYSESTTNPVDGLKWLFYEW